MIIAKNSTKTLNGLGYTDGKHEVYAQHRQSIFHIGFFLFRRDKDTYTTIEYFRDKNSHQKKLERTLPFRFFTLQYNVQPIMFHGIPIKTVRKEMIYKNKAIMNRNKDKFDREQLASKINQQVLEQLSGMHHYRTVKISSI